MEAAVMNVTRIGGGRTGLIAVVTLVALAANLRGGEVGSPAPWVPIEMALGTRGRVDTPTLIVVTSKASPQSIALRDRLLHIPEARDRVSSWQVAELSAE